MSRQRVVEMLKTSSTSFVSSDIAESFSSMSLSNEETAKGRRKKTISCGPVRKVQSPPPVRQTPFFCVEKIGFFYRFSICISKDPE